MANYHKATLWYIEKPSPNLPNDKAINLYPSLCFFEGANVSLSRTEFPFRLMDPLIPKTLALSLPQNRPMVPKPTS